MSLTAIGQIIDTDDLDQLVNELKILPLGHLTNIKKSLEGEYQRVETTKNALGKLVISSKDTEKVEQAKKTIEQLYIALQRIEDRATLLMELIKDKEPKH